MRRRPGFSLLGLVLTAAIIMMMMYMMFSSMSDMLQ